MSTGGDTGWPDLLLNKVREIRDPVEITQVVTHLLDALGALLVAVITGAEYVDTVEAWARGDSSPDPAQEQTLRIAWEVVQLLTDVDSAETVRAWFNGMSPELDDAAPALLLRADPERVLRAARYFRAVG